MDKLLESQVSEGVHSMRHGGEEWSVGQGSIFTQETCVHYLAAWSVISIALSLRTQVSATISVLSDKSAYYDHTWAHRTAIELKA